MAKLAIIRESGLVQYPQMMKSLYFLLLITLCLGCRTQEKKSVMTENKTNPLMCDPQSGMCEMPETVAASSGVKTIPAVKPVRIIYYTDPICSSCWGIEPQLRKLKSEYGDYIEIDYRMGGLLPDWSYNSGGISKPSDVAHHWDEASLYYEMPIDGDVWLEDPLDSSYPSCIAMKAAQLQDKDKAVTFMRIMREKLYLDKKNIAKWENIAEAAALANLDVALLKQDYMGQGKIYFEQDLALARQLGVRGFPTMFFTDASDNRLMIYGAKPYQAYENAILALYPDAKKKQPVTTGNPLALFDCYPTLTAKEYAVILNHTTEVATSILDQLVQSGSLDVKTIKTGKLYKRK